MNNYSWSVPIEKLMLWRTNSWIKYETKCDDFILRLHYDQVLITSDSKVLESLNLNNKMKGIYKEDILILFINLSGKEIRKIKFQIKSDMVQCLQKLGKHFPISSYNESKIGITKYRNVKEVLQSALTQLTDTHGNPNLPMPAEYSNFITLCLLDPTFPQVVKETEKFLKEQIL